MMNNNEFTIRVSRSLACNLLHRYDKNLRLIFRFAPGDLWRRAPGLRHTDRFCVRIDPSSSNSRFSLSWITEKVFAAVYKQTFAHRAL
jgi:hypothetical protein